jgi:hypothetical protein
MKVKKERFKIAVNRKEEKKKPKRTHPNPKNNKE